MEINIKEKLQNLTEKVTDIAETGYQLAMVNLTEKVAQASSNTIIITVTLLLLNFLLLFIGIGTALWIGSALDNYTLGFFIISGVYLLIILLLLLLRRKVIVPFFRNIIIKKMYE